MFPFEQGLECVFINVAGNQLIELIMPSLWGRRISSKHDHALNLTETRIESILVVSFS